MKGVSSLLVLSLIFASCCRPPEDDEMTGPCDPPPQDWFSLEIQDGQGQNLLESTYHPDSLLLSRPGDTIPTWSVDDARLAIPFTPIDPQVEYFLQLSPLDQDTLHIYWKSYGETCIGYELDSLAYNQRTALEVSGLSAVVVK